MKHRLTLLLALALTACSQPNGSGSQETGSAQPAASQPVASGPARPAPATASSAAPVTDAGPGEPMNPGYNQKDVPPDFRLPVLANGKGEMTLREFVGPDSKSGVEGVIVAFTASWCGRCKASYPTLERLQKEHGKRLKILLLTAEEDEAGKEKMAALAKELGLTLPLLDAPPDLIEAWLGTKRNIPRFYLIDYKGMVRVKDTGFGSKMEKLLPEHTAWLLNRREADEKAASQL